MRWSALKQAIERRFAPSLRARVVLRSISYRKAHDDEGRGVIVVDGTEVWSMCTLAYWYKEYDRLQERRAVHGVVSGDRNIVSDELEAEGILPQYSFHLILADYLNHSIEESLATDNPLARSLAMLDIRLGKRRLLRLDMSAEHPMVRYFHALRCSAENLSLV